MSGLTSDTAATVRDPAAAYFSESRPRPQDPPTEEPAPDPSRREKLEAADAAAKALPALPAPHVVTPCPLKQKLALEVLVTDANGAPAADVAVELRQSDTEALVTKANADGYARFEGLESTPYTLSLAGVDADAWEIAAADPLEAERLHSYNGPAVWAAPAQLAEPVLHVIEAGECAATVGHAHGLLADTVWAAPENQALAKLRDNKNVLKPGDVLTIPAARRADVAVEAGKRYGARFKAAASMIRVRFMDAGDKPRAAVPYLLHIVSPAGAEDRIGDTDADGFLNEAVSPDASAVMLTLGKPPGHLVYDLLVAALDPIDTVSGVQHRLENLGYCCGDDAIGTLGPYTKRALLDFQRDHALPETLEPDAATQQTLKAVHAS